MSLESNPEVSKKEQGKLLEEKRLLTEVELRNREQELKRRYEDPHRQAQAENFRNERKLLREEERQKIEQLKAGLLNSFTSAGDVVEGEVAKFDQSNNYLTSQLAVGAEQRAVLEEKRKSRGLFEKLKYSFVSDPLVAAVESLSQVEARHKAEIEENLKKIAEAKGRLEVDKEKKLADNGKVVEAIVDGFKDRRLDQRDRLRKVNLSSREAIRNTFLSMEAGELDISKLARENNAVVVHTIPLDGWSMKNTSMNNTEVDVEKLTAKEKSDILLTKQPDLSASVLSAGEAIPGQDMFYPFGIILDGKIVASYQGDEGTIAAGDSRRRKEMYQGTLQSDTSNSFASVARSPAQTSQGGNYNESIVHKPVPKGILIDEQKLLGREDMGDEVKEDFLVEEEDRILKQYGESITSTGKGVPTSGPNAGKSIFRINRKRTATEKALDYATKNHPGLPVYLRRSDGIYTQEGKKVTAEEIYS